ncbi:hypothetical protein NPS01_26600 [Nocardioides psychrotolerans]|uniref:Pyridoxamine 5'-phosphate oxidase n=1 Tax=Nocardioides psychrotolerans TaxID=1005945 RepID=A0A1I3MSD3_9ACTN|nr:pyridoxamine 5'-phosphate oxidase family protein [Nocardioides psychrotolerans]GEP38997.1 hypothetical protein NPS01_26600 [Nocardioides psychrotolerans]SFI99606.1 Pyridoxamine 5'-phosphate oxidase [Nocardioides psychrotolerans]
MSYAESPVRELGPEECWALLRGDELGRLAYHLVDEVHVVPINYVVDDGELLFRTVAGNKLLAAALGSEVAFEIDWHDHDHAWSVLARGRLRVLDEVEEHRLDGLPLRPWVATYKYDVVGLRPTVVTGRAFELDRGAGGTGVVAEVGV